MQQTWWVHTWLVFTGLQQDCVVLAFVQQA
jgi:hypothetical protein